MYIIDLVKNSRRPKVRFKRICEVKRYFLSMYRCYMVQLYDKGFISDPTIFDKKEIIQNIVEMDISDIFTYTGKIDLTSEHIQFAKFKNKENEDAYEFLSILYNAVQNREYSETIDKIYETHNFNKVPNPTIRNNMCVKGSLITQKFGIPFDMAFARCISKFEEDTQVICFNDKLWDVAMKELGIPDEDFHKDGLFDKQLSHEEEVECMEGILNGFYKVSGGKYTNVLQKWLLSHKWNYESKTKFETKGVFDFVFSSQVNVIEGIITGILNDIESKKSEDYKVTILAIEKNKIFYNVPREEVQFPYGVFGVICDRDANEYFYPEGNIINGFTGEVYTLDRLVEDDISYVGCPILLSTDGKDLNIYYDLEQTNVSSDSWYKSEEGVDITFTDDEEELPKNNYPKGSLNYELYEGYIDSLKSSSTLIKNIKIHSKKELDIAKNIIFKLLGCV